MKLGRVWRWLVSPTPVAFCVRVLILLPALTLITLTPPFERYVEQPLIHGVAWTSHQLLSVTGAASRQQGAVINAPEFAVEIVSGCTGIFAFVLFLTAVVAFPSSWRAKLRGLLAGAAIIFVLNQVRIVTLFLVGRRFPDLFHELHAYVWQGIIIVAIAYYWYAWAARASQADGAAAA